MVTKHTVTGTYKDGSGRGLSGVLLFSPSVPVAHADDNIILPDHEMEVDLVDGTFTVELYATDDAGWSGQWQWQMRERFIGGISRVRAFALTADLDIADVIAPAPEA